MGTSKPGSGAALYRAIGDLSATARPAEWRPMYIQSIDAGVNSNQTRSISRKRRCTAMRKYIFALVLAVCVLSATILPAFADTIGPK